MKREAFNILFDRCRDRGHHLEITLGERHSTPNGNAFYHDLGTLRIRDMRTGKVRTSTAIPNGDLDAAARVFA